MSILTEWKSQAIEAVSKCKNKLVITETLRIPYYRASRRRECVLRDEAASRGLGRLQEKYVIAVVDKAGKNYSFICK